MNKTRASSIAVWSRVLVGCVAVAISLTAIRVAQLKTAPGEQLVRSMERPNGQLIQQRAAEEPEPRGRIVDRVGRLLALDTVGGRLFIDVRDLYTDALEAAERAERKARGRASGDAADAQKVSLAAAQRPMLDPIGDLAADLSRPLGVPAGDIAARIQAKVPAELRILARDMSAEDWKRLPRFVVLEENLTDSQIDALAEAKRSAGPRGLLRGAHVQPKSVRLRPFEELAAAVIGRTTPDGVGLSGAEHRDNKDLAPTAGRTLYFADSRGQVISVPANGHLAGEPGDEVRLSIDMVVQEIVEREINKTVAESNSGGARCLVVCVETGEILAAYDTLFEPGSIFKPFVWGWAIDLGKARANETIRLPDGPLTVTDGRARRTIREAHTSSYGTKSWHDCLTKSVNAGMATVALRMSTQEMKDCLSSFGFGMRTGIGLGGESAGILPPADEWTNRTRAQVSVSFGQGVAVTPLQLMHAFTAFCRDGTMVPLALEPRDPRAQVVSRRALGESSALVTREVMEDVIRQGTGKKLKDILRYTAFGKSGTAQLVNPKGGYYDGRYISSFIIGAPMEDPKIAVLVTIEDPDKVRTKGSYGGGALAGPCSAHIVNGTLEYLGVPTDGELVYADKKDDKKGEKKDEKKPAGTVAAAR
ncbi:MAG: penicillin-binding protein 2 [Planctomycetota bacterium]|nr:penicillin-binding protein 2 [Planctomycetota bacterium]